MFDPPILWRPSMICMYNTVNRLHHKSKSMHFTIISNYTNTHWSTNAVTFQQATCAALGFGRAVLHSHCISLSRLQFFSCLQLWRTLHSCTRNRSCITLYRIVRFISYADPLPGEKKRQQSIKKDGLIKQYAERKFPSHHLGKEVACFLWWGLLLSLLPFPSSRWANCSLNRSIPLGKHEINMD